MRKFFICLCVLLFSAFICPNKIKADNYFNEVDDVIYFEDDVLYLNGYEDLEENEGDYAIYAEDDLTICLTGNNVISFSDGIYVEGNLTVIGGGTLTVNYLEVFGNLNLLDGTVVLSKGSDSYAGPRVSYPCYTTYVDTEGTLRKAQFYENGDTYIDYLYENSIDSSITLSSNVPSTDLSKIKNINGSIYREDEELKVYAGVVNEVNASTCKVSTGLHTDNHKIYNIEFIDKKDELGYLNCYIEFVYEESEWGKVVYYDIIESNNVYDVTSGNPKLTSITNYSLQKHYIGGDSYYSVTKGSTPTLPSSYIQYLAKDNNSITIKLRGDKDPSTDNYVWINMKVSEKKDKQDNNNEYHQIPNTGVYNK